MSNLPEVTKPNWSTEKPTFEEVEGKYIVAEHYCAGGAGKSVLCGFVNVVETFNFLCTGHLLRYCILDLTTPEEPMEYKRMMPTVIHGEGGLYIKWISPSGEWHETDYFPTREEAIHSWNRFVKAMEAVNDKPE